MGVPVRLTRAAVLAAEAVAPQVLIVGAGNLVAMDLDRAGMAHLARLGLVQRELGGREEPARGLERRQAQVAAHDALKIDRLGLHLVDTRVVPLLDAEVLPVHAVQRGLHLHLRDVAVAAVILARRVDELVEREGLAVVDGHRHADGLVGIAGVEILVALVIVVEGKVELAPAVPATPIDMRRLGAVAPRVLERLYRDGLAPSGVPLLGPRADLKLMGAVIRQVRNGKLDGVTAGDAVCHAVDLDVIGCRTLDLVPRELDARGREGVLGSSKIRRGLEGLVERVARQLAGVHEALDLERLLGFVHVGLGELDVQLGRGVDRLLGELLATHLLALGGGVVVEVRRLLEEVHRGAVLGLRLLELVERVDLLDLELGLAVLGDDALWLGGDVHRELSGAGALVALIRALRLAGRERGRVALDMRGERGLDARAVAHVVLFAVLGVRCVRLVLDVGARVLEQRVGAVARRGEELDVALGAVDVRRVVVGLVHGNNRVRLHEQRQLPQRCLEVVEHLAATVLIAREVVDPDVLGGAGQVDVVAHVVAVAQALVVRVTVGVLVHGSDQEAVAEGVLVLRRRALGIGGVIGEQDGTHHGQAGVAIARVDVGRRRRRGVQVRHERALELEIHAGDAGIRVAMGLGRLDVRSPAVHVEHERGEGLPLVIARGDDGIAAKDAVHIGADVGVAGQRLADVGGNMEADVLPVAAVLVARPDAGEALGARPAVERDDVRALVHALGHDVVGGLGSVECHGVAGADPCDVGLEGGHTALLDLGVEVAQQLPLRVRVAVGREVGLRPQAGGHALARRVVGELLEVLDIGGNGVEALLAARAIGVHAAGLAKAVLAVARAIPVIGQEVAQGHVVVHVAVQAMPGREFLGEVGACGDVLVMHGGAVAVERLDVRVGLHSGTGAALLVLDLAGVRVRGGL